MAEIQTSAKAQLDIFDHDPRRLADLNRIAADTARVAYNFPPFVRAERVQHYLAEAERYDALATQSTPIEA